MDSSSSVVTVPATTASNFFEYFSSNFMKLSRAVDEVFCCCCWSFLRKELTKGISWSGRGVDTLPTDSVEVFLVGFRINGESFETEHTGNKYATLKIQ